MVPVIRVENWLTAYRREVASLLTQERDTEALSKQEAEESTGKSLSYSGSDVLIVDWKTPPQNIMKMNEQFVVSA